MNNYFKAYILYLKTLKRYRTSKYITQNKK